MRSRVFRFTMLCLGASLPVLFFSGCGRHQESRPSARSQEQADPVALDISKTPAAQMVESFFNAMLQGDKPRVHALLTPKARNVCAARGLPFAPTPSETTGFSITKARNHEENQCDIVTYWMEKNREGKTMDAGEIVWKAVKTEEGWRIAGAAAVLFEGQEQTVLDFEDPEGMILAISGATQQERNRLEMRRPIPGPLRSARPIRGHEEARVSIRPEMAR